jgi:hypothetical protein
VLAKVLTCALVGLDGVLVEVETDIGPGLPAFNVVGLPDTAIQEARERVRAAIRNSGCVPSAQFRCRKELLGGVTSRRDLFGSAGWSRRRGVR